MKIKLGSGGKWEDIIGYSRAVKSGNVIEIAGTTSFKNGEIAFYGDAYGQTKYILEVITDVLKKLGAGPEDVVRTRMYIKNIEDWEHVGRAHGEVFAEIKPASTMIVVTSMIHPDMLVEIEATAIISD